MVVYASLATYLVTFSAMQKIALLSHNSVTVEAITTTHCGSVDRMCSAALTRSKRNLSLVNTKLPAAAAAAL